MRFTILSTPGLLAFVCAASAQTTRPDLNAFVNHKITDTKSLVTQVRRDGEVSDRYQRHFAMNRAELVAYLKGLHRGSLAKEGMYTIYSVPKDGRVKMHIGKLKRGEAVFLDKQGKTILVAKCGNPVVLGPARARLANALTPPPTEEAKVRELTDDPIAPVSEIVENPDNLLAMVPPVPELAPTALVPAAPLAAPLGAPAVPAIAAVGATATGGAAGFPFLALLPLGALGFIHSDGGGDGGGISPVPEPATMAAMGLGVAALFRRRRKV